MNCIESRLGLRQRCSEFSRFPPFTFSVVMGFMLVLATTALSSVPTIEFVNPPFISHSLPSGVMDRIIAKSSDGTAVRYRIDSAPSGLTIDSILGDMLWQPTTVGQYSAIIRAELRNDPAIYATYKWDFVVIDPTGFPDCTEGSVWHSFDHGNLGWVHAIATNNNDLYAFHNLGSYYGATGVSQWNGSYWKRLFTLRPNQPIPAKMVYYQGELLITGSYWDSAGKAVALNLLRWNGMEILPVGDGHFSVVNDMIVANGMVYICGLISVNSSVAKWAIATWNGKEVKIVEATDAGKFLTLAAIDDRLFVGGTFINAGPESKLRYLAEIKGDVLAGTSNDLDQPIIRMVTHKDGLLLSQPTRLRPLVYWTEDKSIDIPHNYHAFTYDVPFTSFNGDIYIIDAGPDQLGRFQYQIWKYHDSLWIPVSPLKPGIGKEIEPAFAQYDNTLLIHGWLKESCGLPVSNISQLCDNETCGTLTGVTYFDRDESCTRDTGEPGIAGAIIRIEPGPYYVTSKDDGSFTTYLPLNRYSVAAAKAPHWSQTCQDPLPAVYSSPDPDSSRVEIGLYASPGINDVRSSVTTSVHRPGREAVYSLSAHNIGTESASGTITLILEPHLRFVSASQQPAQQIGNRIVWQLKDLQAGGVQQINTRVLVDSTTPRGTEVCCGVAIELENGIPDRRLWDNVDSVCSRVMASFDPNDIAVTPVNLPDDSSEFGIETLHLNDTVLTYQVRFQNTGNDTAFRVVVRDTLDPNLLDIASIELGVASHAYDFSIEGHGVLVWTFDNIMLPDSNMNEIASHGSFKYRIHLQEGLAPLTEIPNNASIYFDYNVPVKTNTVVSITNGSLSVIEDAESTSDVQIYPNPAHGASIVNFTLAESAGVRVRLVDTKGGTIREVIDGRLERGEYRYELGTEDLSTGLYFVTIERNGSKEAYPIVVTR